MEVDSKRQLDAGPPGMHNGNQSTENAMETTYRVLDMHLQDAIVEAYWAGEWAVKFGLMDTLAIIWGI